MCISEREREKKKLIKYYKFQVYQEKGIETIFFPFKS